MTFWETATVEQKLAQIDGGIELGMTAKQVAMCLGAPTHNKGTVVGSFAHRRGRKFTVVGNKVRGGMVSSVLRSRAAGKPDYEIVSAFDIFGHAPPSTNLFEAYP